MKKRRFWARLLLLTFVLTAVSKVQGVRAAEPLDISRPVSLTVCFEADEVKCRGVEFQIYQIAKMSESMEFTLTGAFQDYPVSLKGLDSAGWRALTQTLEAYIVRDKIKPFDTEETGNDGRAVFDDLGAGLYLVTGHSYRSGSYTYTPEPFLAALPGRSQESDAWIYHASASCKYDSHYRPSGGGGSDGTVQRKVLKVWNDGGDRGQRPDEIVVQLLRDDEVYDTVVLNAENNWRYLWEELDSGFRWRVTEYDTPPGYTVSVERQGITFVMTNTYRPFTDIPDGEIPQGWPYENIPDDLVPLANLPGGGRLPQTGMLWWPVPMMAGCGLFLFLSGWKGQDHEKK